MVALSHSFTVGHSEAVLVWELLGESSGCAGATGHLRHAGSNNAALAFRTRQALAGDIRFGSFSPSKLLPRRWEMKILGIGVERWKRVK